MAVWFSPPAGLEAYAHNLDVSSVTDAQFGVIRSFLLRVHELTTEARVAMAFRLAAPVADAMHHRAPPGVHPEQFLVAVAAAYQRRHAPAPVAASAPPSAGYARPRRRTRPASAGARTPRRLGLGATPTAPAAASRRRPAATAAAARRRPRRRPASAAAAATGARHRRTRHGRSRPPPGPCARGR